MSIQSFFNTLTSTRTRRRSIRRRSPVSRPWLEALEDRCLLSFSPAISYPVGVNPNAVVTADFNGDGRLDIALANDSSNTVSIMLGNADGTFGAAQNYATGAGPQSVAVGDFNGDGKLDLVTANSADGSVSILLGNGDGTFQAPQSLVLPGEFPAGYTGSTALPQTPTTVAVGDFNGDGKLDLAVRGLTSFSVLTYSGYYGNFYTTYTDGYVNVLLGNGGGSFTPKAATHLDNANSGGLSLGDFTGDGKLDAMTLDNNGGVNVFPGNGDGTLGAEVHSTSGVDFMTTGDLNGDGKLDLVTRSVDGNGLLVQMGNGDGTFGAAQTLAGIGSTAQLGDSTVQDWVVGDVNGDGKLDITAVTSATQYTSCGYYGCYDPVTTTYAKVLLGHGDGSFNSPSVSNLGSHADYGFISGSALADFNGDGFADLAATDYYANTVSVALNTGSWPTLQVSGFPSPDTAGQSHSITVTAEDASGNVLTGYTDTVHFSSSDGQAVLPADYTFTAADKGTHTFTGVDLKTAGTESISVSDATASITGIEDGITVNAAAASTMSVTGFPSSSTAGVAGNFTVALEDAYGNIASGYMGTVKFTSSDGKASLPANYTFTAADAGVHTFSATLKTAGTQSITAADTTTGSLTATDGSITVNAAAASQFIISAPSSVTAGVAFNLTVTVEDAYGNVVTGYTGRIRFSSTDNRAKLPANYTFTATDKGVHTFTGLILRKTGNVTITITDTLNSVLTDSVIVNVLAKRK